MFVLVCVYTAMFRVYDCTERLYTAMTSLGKVICVAGINSVAETQLLAASQAVHLCIL